MTTSLSLSTLPLFTPTKAFPAFDLENAKHITALGNLCSATQQLPTSAVLTERLEKRGTMVAASGGLMDTWLGDLGDARVVIKTPRIYSVQGLTEAKEVSKQQAQWGPVLERNF